MNTTDRILGESTSQAFDDLMKLSSSLKNGGIRSDEILDMVRAYERNHGLSEELYRVFLDIIDAAQNIEDHEAGVIQHLKSERFHRTQILYDRYNEYVGDLFYTVIHMVQVGKINTGGMLDQILSGDPFSGDIDLSIPTAKSNPYIDAIANTFGRNPSEVMATAEYIVPE
jgi:hypothetical protein